MSELQTSNLSTELIAKLAQTCKDAEEKAYDITRLTEFYPELSVDDAYVIQKKLVDLKHADGVNSIGLKLGLTSVAKQKMMGVHEPTYGTLFDYMLINESEAINTTSLIHPKIEPEIAFYLNEDLEGPSVTGVQVMKATKYIMPALEVIDSRYKNFKFTLPDVVADNSSSARVILGGKAVKVSDVDLNLLGIALYKNNQLETTGAAGAVLGNPATAVAWLVRKLYEQGEKVRKGDLILSGAITEAISISSGDWVEARFEKLGSISIHCE
jgi:2-oxo-3-hexenedioate decarboxylase